MKVGDKYEDGIIVEYDEIAGKGVLFYEGVLAGGRFPTEKELNHIHSLGYIDDQHRYAILPKFLGKNIIHLERYLRKSMIDCLSLL